MKKIISSLNKVAIFILIVICSILFDRFFNYLISEKENLTNQAIVYESYSYSKGSAISFYPGYMTKMNGKIWWHPQKPVFNEEENDWYKSGAIEVTGCTFDPWPFTSGSKDLILEIKN